MEFDVIVLVVYIIVALGIFFSILSMEYPNDTIQDRVIYLVISLLWPIWVVVLVIISIINLFK